MHRLSHGKKIVLLCLFILITGAFYYLYLPSVDQLCENICAQLIHYAKDGKLNIGLTYQSFKLANSTHVNISDKLTYLQDKDTGFQVPCKYHAVQAAFFTLEKLHRRLFGKYPLTGNLMLQMRHDSLIGLPGGGGKVGETLTQALSREIHEELGRVLQSQMKYELSYWNPDFQYCGHLFSQEMSLKELRQLMMDATASEDTGFENMGYFFLPILNEVDDDPGYDGFPTFIAQAISPKSPPTMVGNTLQQLIYVLTESTIPPILSTAHLQLGIKKACQLIRKSTCESTSKLLGATLSNFYQ
ncbi:U8 snoRNA-decapping enzyme [Paragonimus skrjabini miyazakii]|uniref:U8 snoRNA-decapping enzyme n=1 Tax=Paragonimus skrjabini miyazakii TaxID=59628 RepID=A0A8S9YRL5_9TREM|nr:U8 snoRNA-decapping enzyme [Paragonimus skrjabini miyazakii]